MTGTRQVRGWLVVVTVGVVVLSTLGPAGASPGQQPAGKGRPESPGRSAEAPDHSADSPGRSAEAPGRQYVAEELLVRFDPAITEAERQAVRRKHRLTKLDDLPIDGLELVRTTSRGRVPEHASQVARERTVRYAEPNYLVTVDAQSDDPAFEYLWGFENTAQFVGSVADADADVTEGWDAAADTSDLVVAVIDEGVDITHADLAPNIWVNVGEIPDNGFDDDGNGFVDDVNGWDFYWGDNTVFDPADGDDHGTHVAGTIAAVADNGLGVAGVSQAKIMPLKFLGPGGGDTADAVEAIYYAIDNGADLMNNSWGGEGKSTALGEAIQDAADAGILFVAAAGNGGDDQVGDNNDATPHYPSSYEHGNVVSVAASTFADELASFSNYGATSVDIAAPGDLILSTVPGRNAKVVLSTSGQGKVAFHSFGLEGVVDAADRADVAGAALTWAGVGSSDSILLVPDAAGQPFAAEYYGPALAGYSSVTTAAEVGAGCGDGPALGSLNPPPEAVVWFTGWEYSCTLTPNDRSEISSYLSGGGTVILFGQDIAEELDTEEPTFLANTLGVDLVAPGDHDYGLVGTSGTSYGDIELVLTGTGDYIRQDYADAIAPRPGAAVGMSGTGPSAMKSGTSMATPFVTGMLAHLLAKYPAMPPAHVKQLLLDLADHPGFANPTLTNGRVNLASVLATGTIAGTATATVDGGVAPLANGCVLASSSPTGLHDVHTRTDSSGAYSVTVPPGDYRVQFRDCESSTHATQWYGGTPDWGTASIVTVTAGNASSADATLPVGGSVSGTVTADGSAPLGGICVDGFTQSGTHVGRDVTDGTGMWSIPGFIAGDHVIRYRDCSRTDATQRATLWHGASIDRAGASLVPVSSGSATTGLTAQLPVAGAVAGTVVTAAGGTNPELSDICVSVYTGDGYFIGRSRTAADGTYTVRGMGTGPYKVRFNDCSGRDYTTEWWNDATEHASADAVSVNAGATTSGINAALS